MAVETITPGEIHKHARQWEHTALTTELLLASGVVVLSILGIAGVFPIYLAAIACHRAWRDPALPGCNRCFALR